MYSVSVSVSGGFGFRSVGSGVCGFGLLGSPLVHEALVLLHANAALAPAAEIDEAVEVPPPPQLELGRVVSTLDNAASAKRPGCRVDTLHSQRPQLAARRAPFV